METDPAAQPTDPDPAPRGRYRWLEYRLFPAIIGYTVHPLHIVALLALWIGLLVFHSTLFELVGGNYTNGLSAMAASIVLLQQTRQQRELRHLHRSHQELLERVHRLLARKQGTETASGPSRDTEQ